MGVTVNALGPEPRGGMRGPTYVSARTCAYLRRVRMRMRVAAAGCVTSRPGDQSLRDVVCGKCVLSMPSAHA